MRPVYLDHLGRLKPCRRIGLRRAGSLILAACSGMCAGLALAFLIAGWWL